jgi:hypothetical protein
LFLQPMSENDREEVVKVLQAMSLAKPATDPDSGFDRLDGVARRGADKARYFD